MGKVAFGYGNHHMENLTRLTDSNNPKAPSRTATVWMNTAVHRLLKFSIQCWKVRNNMVHGSTWQEKKQIALQKARDNITRIYENPPQLATSYRSIFEIPLAHPYGSRWSLIKPTSHNTISGYWCANTSQCKHIFEICAVRLDNRRRTELSR